MKRELLASSVAAVLVAAAATASMSIQSTTVLARAISGCAPSQLHLYRAGQLTVATDAPAYTPWFEKNQPRNGKGYESAVAYAVAKAVGFKQSQVHWTIESFDSSYAPGPKTFDFDINEITITAARAKAVTFSEGYYNDHEALITVKGSPLLTAHSPSQLKTYKFGDQVGTTSLSYIEDQLQATQTPAVYNSLNDAVSALSDHTIQGFVTDAPTAQYMAASGEVKHGVVVGQFPSNDESFGLLFHKGNPLVSCVNRAITQLKNNGTLTRLQKKWLGIYTSIPTIQP